MTYTFDTQLAKAIGTDEAIFAKTLASMVAESKASGNHYYGDKYWVCASSKSFLDKFDFWNENQIRRVLKSLLTKGVVLRGRVGKDTRDRTYWYTFTDKYWYLVEQAEKEGETQ